MPSSNPKAARPGRRRPHIPPKRLLPSAPQPTMSNNTNGPDDHRAALSGRHPTPTDQVQTPAGTSRQPIVAAQHPAALRRAGSKPDPMNRQPNFAKKSRHQRDQPASNPNHPEPPAKPAGSPQ